MALALAMVVGRKEGHIRGKVGARVEVHIDHCEAEVFATAEVLLGENKNHLVAS